MAILEAYHLGNSIYLNLLNTVTDVLLLILLRMFFLSFATLATCSKLSHKLCFRAHVWSGIFGWSRYWVSGCMHLQMSWASSYGVLRSHKQKLSIYNTFQDSVITDFPVWDWGVYTAHPCETTAHFQNVGQGWGEIRFQYCYCLARSLHPAQPATAWPPARPATAWLPKQILAHQTKIANSQVSILHTNNYGNARQLPVLVAQPTSFLCSEQAFVLDEHRVVYTLHETN